MKTTKKRILLYGFHKGLSVMQGQQLANRAAGMQIEVINVALSDYGKTIGEMAGLFPAAVKEDTENRNRRKPEEEISVRMLVMCGIAQPEMEGLLQLFRECGMTGDDLKAVLTPSNAFWNGVTLAEELKEEHRRMMK